MGKTYVMGDIHGAHRALAQCLRRASFQNTDQIIFLGDVCDGWPDTRACIDELLTIRNLVFVLGNHDWWMLEWMKTGKVEDVWYTQGGKATIDSYESGKVPDSHVRLLENALPYYVVDNKLFVHAGIDGSLPLDVQSTHTFLWDRAFARQIIPFANNTVKKFTTFDEIYIGHTPVSGGLPIRCGEVWMMDTGAGWTGTLSMMNISTKEIFSSDIVPSLYPGVKGRATK
jgi:serine/threonine protein phosphatase 1